MNLVDALETLVDEHDRIGSPLRDRLGPGQRQVEIDSVMRGLGLAAPSELIDLFAWHDVRDDPGDDSRITWFWPAAPFRLHEAAADYRHSIAIGGITAADLESIELKPESGATFTGFWRTDWLPILYGAPEIYALECRPEIHGSTPAPVWRVNRHPDSTFQTVQVASSLAELVTRVVELFRAGAYEWSTEDQAIVTVDDVFERLGLGTNDRPWP